MAAYFARNMFGLRLCQRCGLPRQREYLMKFTQRNSFFIIGNAQRLQTKQSFSLLHRPQDVYGRGFLSIKENTRLQNKRFTAEEKIIEEKIIEVKKKATRPGTKILLFATGVFVFGYLVFCRMTKSSGPGRPSEITLYRRMPLKAMSRLWGKFNKMELPIFLRKPLLSLYIWMFGCNLEEAEIEDLKHYKNLGEFFRRQLKPHVRPIDDDHVLTSPADGKILYHGQVKDGILEQVKGVTYSLRGFLGPQTWESASHGQDINHQSDEDYQQDLALHPGNELHHVIIYLAPGDYHRFHSPATWTVDHRRHFPGELLSVNPGVARWVQGLFSFNERAIYTGRWEHGFFSMAAVGATNVGSIKIYCDEDLETNTHVKHPEHTYFDRKFPEPVVIQKGDMFGEFNLGSTIVLIFEAPHGFKFKAAEGEKIKFGRPLGTTP